jgi:hypothetical protein
MSASSKEKWAADIHRIPGAGENEQHLSPFATSFTPSTYPECQRLTSQPAPAQQHGAFRHSAVARFAMIEEIFHKAERVFDLGQNAQFNLHKPPPITCPNMPSSRLAHARTRGCMPTERSIDVLLAVVDALGPPPAKISSFSQPAINTRNWDLPGVFLVPRYF